MSPANKTVVRRFHDAINAGRLDVIDEVIAESFVEHEAFPGLSPGRDGTRQMFEMFRTAFSNFTMSIEAIIAEDDLVVVRATIRGTHQGEFLGMAPTGKTIAVPFADFVRVEDGKVVEHWGVTDSGAMMQQLS